jgi:hypothetical protein
MMDNGDYENSAMGKALVISINLGESEHEESEDKVTNPGIKLPPAEAKYVESMHEIVDEYGKLADDDGNGIYVGYVPPAENEKAKQGIKCGNCAFYCPTMKNCHIIAAKVQPGGYCRLAAIGDGLVKKEK